jgi:predicted acylesterase/phospholipase RssA
MVKRALVLSGGASRGAYQVGALKALIETGHTWTSIHGISVGSLNAAWLTSHSVCKDYDIAGLIQLWSNISQSEDMIKPWSNIRFFNYLMSIWKGSLNSHKNLKAIIERNIKAESIHSSNIKLTVGCCSMNDGHYLAIAGNNPHIIDFVLASSMLPVVFNPIIIKNEKWVDGGIRHQIPIVEALAERPAEIDIILTRNPIASYDIKIEADMTKLRSAPRMALRASEIMNDQIYQADFNTALRAARTVQNVNFSLYLPEGVSSIKDSLVFNPALIKETIQLGYEETMKVLAKAKGQ